jgi:hypothetical protein
MTARRDEPGQSTSAVVVGLQQAARLLVRRSHAELASLLERCLQCLCEVAPELAHASALGKWGAASRPMLGEEWLSGPVPVARFLRLLIAQQHALVAGRMPQQSAVARPVLTPIVPVLPGEQVCAALPVSSMYDRLLFRGYRAEVYGRVTKEWQPLRRGDVALVLGAGNVTATPLLDVLHQVFLEGRAVLLKVSPQHDALLSLFGRALDPLVASGLVALAAGDGDYGAWLARDPGIAAVHLTGSPTTWLALRRDAMLAGKHLTAETGCCSPVVVMPGRWRQAELLHVARQLAAFVACNGGQTCLAPRLLLTAQAWPQRAQFLQLLGTELASHAARVPFDAKAYQAFARALGEPSKCAALQPQLRANLSAQRDAALFEAEHFAPVLLETSIAASSPVGFAERVAALVSGQVFGALSASVFACPQVLRKERAAIQQLAAALPHGSVVLNGWAGLAFGLGSTPWGVADGVEIAHGRGFVRGTIGMPAPRKVLIEAPFRPRPLPPWLPQHRRGLETARALTALYERPGLWRCAAVAAAGMRS